MLHSLVLITASLNELQIINFSVLQLLQGKGQVNSRTGHEGPDGEYNYSSTPSLTSVIDGVDGQRHAPVALSRGKRPRTRCTGGCMGPSTGLDGCGKFPIGTRSPDPPDRSQSLYRLSYPIPHLLHAPIYF
jgi:hypothetical protein